MNFRRLDLKNGIRLGPARLMAELEERAQPFEFLVRGDRCVLPRRSELPERRDIELLEVPVALALAVRNELLVEEELQFFVARTTQKTHKKLARLSKSLCYC